MPAARRRFPITLLTHTVCVLTAACAGLASQALAADRAGAGGGVIFTCTAPDGRRLTSDRPIAECSAREQRMLNPDGSLQRVVPPTLTAEERAVKDARDRQAEIDRLAHLDAIRRDRNLMARYPDEAAHDKAREAALDTVRLAIHASQERIQELASERKPLVDEAEFYKGKPLPPKLRQQLDANDAATEAQRTAVQSENAELDRINRLYDAELARLKRLWAGAAPGSLADEDAAGNAVPAAKTTGRR